MKRVAIFSIVCIASILFITGGALLFQEENALPEQLSLDYAHVGKYQNGYVAVSNGTQLYYISKEGTRGKGYAMTVESNEQLQAFAYTDGVAPFPDNNLVGVIDESENVILPADYQSVIIVDDHTFVVVDKENEEYVTDRKGNRITEGNYYQIEPLMDDLFLATKDSKKGVIKADGNIVIPFDYDVIERIDDYFLATSNQPDGINKIYQLVNQEIEALDLSFTVCSAVDDQYFYLQNEWGAYILYDYQGEKSIRFQGDYVAIGTFHNNLALALNEQMQMGYINLQEDVVIPFMYTYDTSADFTDSGYAVVSKEVNGELKKGLINQQNEEILPFDYTDILVLSDQIVAVSLDDSSYQLLSLADKTPQTETYTTVVPTSRKDLFLVTKGGDTPLYGLLDTQGQEVVPPIYQAITVYDDQVLLQQDSRAYTIDFTI